MFNGKIFVFLIALITCGILVSSADYDWVRSQDYCFAGVCNGDLIVGGGVSSGVLIINESNDGTVEVGGVNTLFIDSTIGGGDPLVITDFTGGVVGQYLNVVVRDNTAETVITDESGSNQEIFLHDTRSNLIIEVGTRGGVILVCDGSDWYDVSHAKHV